MELNSKRMYFPTESKDSQIKNISLEILFLSVSSARKSFLHECERDILFAEQ